MVAINTTPGWRSVEADWSRDGPAIRRVRQAVFVDEQGIPENLEWDGRDARCRHALVLTEAAEVIATGRLLADGRIGRMAVLRAWRGRGAGTVLLERLLQQALDCGLQHVYVHAQVEVAGFYSRAGFQVAGQPFVAAGIAHVEMRKVLAAG